MPALRLRAFVAGVPSRSLCYARRHGRRRAPALQPARAPERARSRCAGALHGGARAGDRRGRPRRPRRAVPGGSGHRHPHAVRFRCGRSHQSAAPDPVCARPTSAGRKSRPPSIACTPSIPTSRSKRSPSASPEDALQRRVEAADVVLDCSDNFATRHAVNRACVAASKPLVSGAAIRFDGQVAVFDVREPDQPCYQCLFGEGDELEETRCATMGVFAPLVGIIGATQAAEALKLVAGVGESLAGRLLLLDALRMQWREVRVPRDPACAVCGSRPVAKAPAPGCRTRGDASARAEKVAALGVPAVLRRALEAAFREQQPAADHERDEHVRLGRRIAAPSRRRPARCAAPAVARPRCDRRTGSFAPAGARPRSPARRRSAPGSSRGSSRRSPAGPRRSAAPAPRRRRSPARSC